MNSNHTYTIALIDNGEWMDWTRRGRKYQPAAKLTLAETFASADEAKAAAETAFEDRGELDHVVVIENDESGEYVGEYLD